RRTGVKPAWLDALQRTDLTALPDLAAGTERRHHTLPDGRELQVTAAEEQLLRLLASPNIASKAVVFRQYDHMVQDNTVIPPGHDAAVLRVKGTQRGLALATDGNGRLVYLDPYVGGMIAVCEAARNVSVAGGEPIAATDCLNFGSPERPDIYYQLEQAIRGMSDACRALGIPVVSGNVSLYNETAASAVYPTPVGRCGTASALRLPLAGRRGAASGPRPQRHRHGPRPRWLGRRRIPVGGARPGGGTAAFGLGP
ncbi:MAG: AIR synthase related protein, partial [Chloroflexi bacterium]|nr:AIR synthase related protein [Chloroflexota bacterium]